MIRNIIRRFFFILTIIVLTLSSNTLYAYEQTKKHFLWVIETERNTIYFLGSIHILKKDSYPLPREIENIYNCCKKIVFETDLDGMNDADSQAKMMKLGMYPAGQKLSQIISTQAYNLLEKKLSVTGLPIAQFEQFKPWFISLTITAMEIQRLGFDPNFGVDRYFFKRAIKDKKEMIFLETNEFQLNLMAHLSRPQQEMFLKETLRELDVIESMSSEMVKAWKTGNIDKLYSIINISFHEYPDIYKRFFTQRNKRWIPKIKQLMRQHDDVLIIVGAGHLVGKDSVIELLREKGYKVRQK